MSDANKPYPFINREQSWLAFDSRVLEEALDPGQPTLERLKFLAITSSNLDEFFMVRVGGLQQVHSQAKNKKDAEGLTAGEQLARIHATTHELVKRQYQCYADEVKPAMRQAGIRRQALKDLPPESLLFLQNLFDHDLYSVLTPMAVHPDEDFPQLPGLGLNLLVRLKPAQGARKFRYAVIALPKKLGRFYTVPMQEGHNYVLMEDIVADSIEKLFPGEPVLEVAPFRITRNADMSVSEDLASDLLENMKEILHARKQSFCVRLEIAEDLSKTSREFLQAQLRVDDTHVYTVPGPIDLGAYFALARMAGFDNLRDKPWPPQHSPQIGPAESMFEAIARHDLLLYHPYESFDPVVRLIEEAADDPDVLAIKQILYRTSEKSPIVAALARAASRDKHVTVIVELKARFDEARNINWAEALEQTGVQVIYGLRGLKTHAKCCLIVRREASGIRRYVHYGTGNYNELTARLYTDVSYMTCTEDYGNDAAAFFNMITGYSQPASFQKIEAAPFGIRPRLLSLIENEAQRSREGQAARIAAKINSLVDEEIIQALYKASQAGVKIDLNVRGICCLRPGVPGLSENIRVTSIVDRFLEHPRILYFHHGGDSLLFISSADWMPRNLDRRVELLVNISDAASKKRLGKVLDLCFSDNVKARQLGPDGVYTRVKPSGKEPHCRSQELFYTMAVEQAKRARKSTAMTLEPQRPTHTS